MGELNNIYIVIRNSFHYRKSFSESPHKNSSPSSQPLYQNGSVHGHENIAMNTHNYRHSQSGDEYAMANHQKHYKHTLTGDEYATPENRKQKKTAVVVESVYSNVSSPDDIWSLPVDEQEGVSNRDYYNFDDHHIYIQQHKTGQ